MEFKDYYKILGVKPDADLKAIKTAYRKLARKYMSVKKKMQKINSRMLLKPMLPSKTLKKEQNMMS